MEIIPERPEDDAVIELPEENLVDMCTIVKITDSTEDPDPSHPNINRSDEWTFSAQNPKCADNTSLNQKLGLLGRERHFHTLLNLRDGYAGALPVVISNAVKMLEYGYHAQDFLAMARYLCALFGDERGFAPYVFEPFSSFVWGVYNHNDNATKGLAILTIVVQSLLDEQAPLAVQVDDTLGQTSRIYLAGHAGLFDLLVHVMEIEIVCRSNGAPARVLPLESLDPREHFQSFEVGLRKGAEVKSRAPALAIDKIVQTSRQLVDAERRWREANNRDQCPEPEFDYGIMEATIRALYSRPKVVSPRPEATAPAGPHPWLRAYEQIVQGEDCLHPTLQEFFDEVWLEALRIVRRCILRLPEYMHRTAITNAYRLWKIMAVRNQPRDQDMFEQARVLVSWTQSWEFSGFYMKQSRPLVADGIGQVILRTHSGKIYRYDIWKILGEKTIENEELQLLFALSRGFYPDEWVPALLEPQALMPIPDDQQHAAPAPLEFEDAAPGPSQMRDSTPVPLVPEHQPPPQPHPPDEAQESSFNPAAPPDSAP